MHQKLTETTTVDSQLDTGQISACIRQVHDPRYHIILVLVDKMCIRYTACDANVYNREGLIALNMVSDTQYMRVGNRFRVTEYSELCTALDLMACG